MKNSIFDNKNLANMIETEEVELVKKLKTIFPALLDIDNEKKEIIKLAQLVEDMSKVAYSSDDKYNLAYKIIEMGNLVDQLLPIKNTKNHLVDVTVPTNINKLGNEQQKAIFIQYRNIIADMFHVMYEKSMKLVLESFANVCKGTFEPSILIHIDNLLFNKLKKGSSVIKIFREEPKPKLEKIYHQTVYFLQKTEEFIKNKKYNEAAMALIAAGTCARNINTSKQNPVTTGSIMQTLTNLRSNMAHIYSLGYNRETMKSQLDLLLPKISKYINKVISEVSNTEINIDKKSIEVYGKKLTTSSSSSDESPRAYESSIFKL